MFREFVLGNAGASDNAVESDVGSRGIVPVRVKARVIEEKKATPLYKFDDIASARSAYARYREGPFSPFA